MIPKSKKLQQEEDLAYETSAPAALLEEPTVADSDSVFKIKPVKCLNDFVAIARSRYQTEIQLTQNQFKNEGTVIGVGSGLTDPQVALGDVVTFLDRNIVVSLKTHQFYENVEVILVQERNLLCKLPSTPFEIIGNASL